MQTPTKTLYRGANIDGPEKVLVNVEDVPVWVAAGWLEKPPGGSKTERTDKSEKPPGGSKTEK